MASCRWACAFHVLPLITVILGDRLHRTCNATKHEIYKFLLFPSHKSLESTWSVSMWATKVRAKIWCLVSKQHHFQIPAGTCLVLPPPSLPAGAHALISVCICDKYFNANERNKTLEKNPFMLLQMSAPCHKSCFAMPGIIKCTLLVFTLQWKQKLGSGPVVISRGDGGTVISTY